jgi:hypothetical protein
MKGRAMGSVILNEVKDLDLCAEILRSRSG